MKTNSYFCKAFEVLDATGKKRTVRVYRIGRAIKTSHYSVTVDRLRIPEHYHTLSRATEAGKEYTSCILSQS